VLVFVDLVAHLIRKNIGLLNTTESSQLDSNKFKFVLFVCFPTREEAIALELMEGLQQICTGLGKDNFELRMRLSNESMERWNEQSID